MKKIMTIIIFLLIVGAICYTLIPTDRNRIKKIVDSCKTAIVNNDITGIMENVSFNYSDDYGNSYLLLKKRMENVLDRFGDFEISTDIMSLEIHNKTAAVELKASVIASDESGKRYLMGDEAWPEDITVLFEKSPSLQWKILRVERYDETTKNNE